MEIQQAPGPKVSSRILFGLGALVEVMLALALPSTYEWQPVFGAALFALLVAIPAAATAHLLGTNKR
jgi:hypothetical protein